MKTLKSYQINFLFSLLLLLLFSTTNYSQCLIGDCKDGYGKLKYKNGDIYIGQFKDGQSDGQGVTFYKNKTKYIGSWEGGKINGDGTFFLGSEIKRGYWIYNRFIVNTKANEPCIFGDCNNGYGILLAEDYSRYIGIFKDGKIKNRVTVYYPDGSKYVGSWSNNEKNGRGTLYKPDGNREFGWWKNNKLTSGKLTKGCIQGDCKNGIGIYQYGDDTRYEGQFKNGIVEGKGTCFYDNGDMYSGEWKNHNFDGKGSMYKSDGTILKGYWRGGEYIGKNNEKISNKTKAKTWLIDIGIARYSFQNSLKYSDDDAYRMYAFFKNIRGGELPDNQIAVLIDEDATYDYIMSTLLNLKHKVGEDDTVIFYYGGYVINNSIIPIDATLEDNQIELEKIKLILSECKAKTKIAIIDGRVIDKSTNSNYEEKLTGSDVTFLISAKESELANENDGLKQGIFSHFLIKGLKGEADFDKDKKITLVELFSYANENVKRYTGNLQTPVMYGKLPEKIPFAVVR